MKIRVSCQLSTPDHYCNDGGKNCGYFMDGGLFGYGSSPRCKLFKSKITKDGNNLIKCLPCTQASGQIVETGCEFCADGELKGYARKYIGNDYQKANPPFCPECGRLRKETW